MLSYQVMDNTMNTDFECHILGKSVAELADSCNLSSSWCMLLIAV